MTNYCYYLSFLLFSLTTLAIKAQDSSFPEATGLDSIGLEIQIRAPAYSPRYFFSQSAIGLKKGEAATKE